MAKKTSIQNYTGEDAHVIAKQKARYSHNDWIVWRDRAGVKHSARITVDTLKQAMLACGTQGTFTLYTGSSALPVMGVWTIACAWLANLKAGFYVG